MVWLSTGAALLAALSAYLLLAPQGPLVHRSRPRTAKPKTPGYLDLAREVLGISKPQMTALEILGVIAVAGAWALLTAGNWSFVLAGIMLGRGTAGFIVELLAASRLRKLDRMTTDYQSTVTRALAVGNTVPKALESADAALSREGKAYLGAVATSRHPSYALDEAATKVHSNSLRLFARLIALAMEKGITVSCFERHDRKQRDEEQIRTEAALDVQMFLYLYAAFLLLTPATFLFDRVMEPAWFSTLVTHLKWWLWLTVPMEAFVFSGLRKFSRLRVGLGRVNT